MENIEDIKYTLKPQQIEVDDVEDVKFPPLNERIIEKSGAKLYFSLKDIEDNIEINNKKKKEVEAKLEVEKAKMENIEHFHPEVKEYTAEQLHTAAMYKTSVDWVELCKKQLEALDAQDKIDRDEIEEIKKQIPELNIIESPYGEKE